MIKINDNFKIPLKNRLISKINNINNIGKNLINIIEYPKAKKLKSEYDDYSLKNEKVL